MVVDLSFLKVKKLIAVIFLILISATLSFAENLNLKKIFDLNDPWGFTFVTDNQILITEKSGKIKFLDLKSKKFQKLIIILTIWNMAKEVY